MDKIRVVIDTDIGDDVDDALAIALALESPEIEVVGITTVYKNVGMRALLVKDMLKAFSKTGIPVVAGYGQPIRYKVDDGIIPYQCRDVSGEPEPVVCRDAVDFIIEQIKRYPDTVIVPIGPFTNIAMAARLAPDEMKDVRIVGMGGAFGAVYPEYNILCDPESAAIVVDSCRNMTLAGLDVTTKCVLSKNDELQILLQTSSKGKYLAKLAEIWLETSKAHKITLHDPLPIAYLINPAVMEVEREPIRIELEGSFTRGLSALCRTPFRQREPYPDSVVGIAKEVNYGMVHEILFGRLFKKE